MAKTFGMLAAATTGFTGVGIIRDYKRATNAEVKYGLAATGAPDSSNAVATPKTMSAELELDGTAPVAGTDDITVGTDVFHVTKSETAYSGAGEVATVSVEGSISLP